MRYALLPAGATTWQTGEVMNGNSRTGQFIAVALNDDGVAMTTFDHYTNLGGNTPANP